MIPKFYCTICPGFIAPSLVIECAGKAFAVEGGGIVEATKLKDAQPGSQKPCGACPKCDEAVWCAVFEP